MRIITAFMMLVFTLTAMASESVAIIKSVKGDATLKRHDVYLPAKAGDWVQSGDVLQTSESSSVGLAFKDGTVISVGPKSMLNVNNYLFEPTKKEYDFDFTLQKGTAAFESGKIGKLAPEKVKFRVPQGLIGIRGTKFVVEAK